MRLVPFLFGVTGRGELPGPALVQLLTDLELTPGAARALLARLRREGSLSTAREGRQVRYRLAGELASGFDRIRHGPPAAPPWPGHFHALLHQVPEQERAFRDQLRRAAILNGFGILTSGVLISLTDRLHHLAALLDKAPPSARVYPGRLAMSDADAVQAAAQAWDLPGLTSTYREHIRHLHSALHRPRQADPADAAALRHLDDLLNPVLIDLLRAPALPAVLRPRGWPMPELRAVVEQAEQRYYPAVAAHVAEVLRPWPTVPD